MQIGQSAQNIFETDTGPQNQDQAYNTSMSNTQYQRTVADMKAAGINPAALYSGKAGTDTAPSTATQTQAQEFQSTETGAKAAIGAAALLAALFLI